MSERFARHHQDRFRDLAWEPGETGVPLLPDTLARIECSVYDRILAGDHDIFVGLVVRTTVADDSPLLHFASHYRNSRSKA